MEVNILRGKDLLRARRRVDAADGFLRMKPHQNLSFSPCLGWEEFIAAHSVDVLIYLGNRFITGIKGNCIHALLHYSTDIEHWKTSGHDELETSLSLLQFQY